MRRPLHLLLAVTAALSLFATACGSDDDSTADAGAAANSCLAGDPNCDDQGDAGAAEPLPTAIALDDEGPLFISFGGFFYADETGARMCASLAESFPPQCGETLVEIVAPSLDVALEHVRESFGDPATAPLQNEQGIWWTDEWTTISGVLQANQLVLE